jgi:hypothetical protein
MSSCRKDDIVKRKNVLGILFCVLSVSCGCSETEEDLIERARRGDKNALLRASEIAERKNQPFLSAEWLALAARAGSREAIERLEKKSADGCKYSLIALTEFYQEVGEKDKSDEMAFQLACKHPGEYAFMMGIDLLFPESGSVDRIRGKQCFVLAAENQTAATYLLLVGLVQDGVLTAESDSEVASWRRLGKQATDREITLLAINLHGWKIEELRKYQEKWPLPPIKQ